MRKSELHLKPWQVSGQIKTFCPLCHEGRKNQSDTSLAVNLDEGGWYCHHCGESGYLEDVQHPMGSSPFASKKKRVYRVPDKEAMKKFQLDPDEKFLGYFQSRGITPETLTAWEVGYSRSFPVKDDNNEQMYVEGIPQYTEGIQFPYFEDGQLVYVKHFLPKEWSPTGKRRFGSFKNGKLVPFGLDRASTDRIILVAGEMDALSVYQSGIDEVWSVPNGDSSRQWLEFESVVSAFQNTQRIYLAGDNDHDGLQAREDLIRRLSILVGPERIYLVEWPDGCKDANDVLRLHGEAVVRACVEDMAQPLPIDGISEADEFIGEYLEFYDNGLPKGVSTGVAMNEQGISEVDQLYRIMPGMLTIVTGVTNYGKSEFMDEIIRCMIEKEKWTFALYSPENSPHSLHMLKLAEKHVGKPFDREKEGHMSREEAVEASKWIADNIFYINPRYTTYCVDEILERAKVLIYRKGIKGLVIDPWNYVRKDFGALREDQYINEEMKKLVIFARSWGIHIWLIVHPRTLRKDKNNKIEVPTVMELSGGSKFGDNADFLFAIHRDPKEAFETGIHYVMLHMQKSRYRPAAKQGYIKLRWEPFNGRFCPGEDAVYNPDNTEFFEEPPEGEF